MDIRRLIACLCLGIFLFFGCQEKYQESYRIDRLKSKSGIAYLNLSTFHFEDKSERYYSTYRINDSVYSHHNLENLLLELLEGTYQIEAGAIGKEWIKIENLAVKNGDSILIRFFLKDTEETTNHGPY